MSFLETPVFPSCVAYGARGGPKFLTNVVVLASGREQRNVVWSKVRAEYDVAHSMRTAVQMDELRDFFYAVQGRAFGFRFKDYTDYSCTLAQGIIEDDGASPSELKLFKRYAKGAWSFDRRIYKPVPGSVVCYLNGSPMPSWSVDYTTGTVTNTESGSPTRMPGDVLRWTGEFDVPVRFDTDRFEVSIDELDAYSWNPIKLVELRFD